MEQLTAQQAKMVIEYFAQQAAEDMPTGSAFEREKHMWRTLLTVSLATGRRITEGDWDALIAAEIDLQQFDREPEGWLNEQGYAGSVEGFGDYLKDQVSLAIDNCLANSGA